MDQDEQLWQYSPGSNSILGINKFYVLLILLSCMIAFSLYSAEDTFVSPKLYCVSLSIDEVRLSHEVHITANLRCGVQSFSF